MISKVSLGPNRPEACPGLLRLQRLALREMRAKGRGEGPASRLGWHSPSAGLGPPGKGGGLLVECPSSHPFCWLQGLEVRSVGLAGAVSWGPSLTTFLKVKVAQSCLTLRDPMDFTFHGGLQATILEWVSLSLLQEIFPTQRSNPGLLNRRQILYQLSHKGTPRILEWVAYPFSRGSF